MRDRVRWWWRVDMIMSSEVSRGFKVGTMGIGVLGQKCAVAVIRKSFPQGGRCREVTESKCGSLRNETECFGIY